MLFSILIANYNNGHFFKDCYKSILSQTYSKWEVIIVDDQSTDNSIQIIKEIIGDDSRFKIYCNSKNHGCGYTKNRCVSLARGEIAGFLDPDDALEKEAIETMIIHHSKYPTTSIITSKYDFVDLEMNFIGKGKQGGAIPVGQSYLTSKKGILTHFASFKKTNYDLSVGINVKIKRAVDQDLYYKLEEQGDHLFLNQSLYLYRIHKNSISANENEFKAQYWHFYAIISAYKRRRTLKMDIHNFTKIQYKKIKSNYYFSRFERAKEHQQYYTLFYFLIKSVLAFPKYKFLFKLKSLVK